MSTASSGEVSGAPQPSTSEVLHRQELTSLDERLGLLLVVRVVTVATVVVAATVAPHSLGADVRQIGPVSAFYLVLSGGLEWFRRSGRRGRLTLHRVMLPIDAVFLVLVTVPGGGPRSQFVFLFAVELIAVTLLASQRTGIRIALWDSLLFVTIPTLSLQSSIGRLLGVHAVAVPPLRDTALAIMGLWAVALCCAVFSSVSERELRRSRSQLGALAAMATELETVYEPHQVLVILLRCCVRTFGFRRGAVYWGSAEGAHAFTCEVRSQVGSSIASKLLGRLPQRWQGARRARVSEPELEVSGCVLPTSASLDRLAVRAWAQRAPVLVRSADPKADPLTSRLLPDASNLVLLPLLNENSHAGILALEYGKRALSGSRMPRSALTMLGAFCAHAGLALRSAQLMSERERLAAQDGLTGLANRREFDRTIAREVSRAKRSGQPLSLVVIDVDHFKAINDTRGHLGGDEVLRQIARALAEAVREMDVVARYGGEEFALVLPACAQGDAVRVLDRVALSLSHREALKGVTVSSGLATMPLNAVDGRGLIEAADEALYASKHGGRNRLTVSSRTVEPALSATK